MDPTELNEQSAEEEKKLSGEEEPQEDSPEQAIGYSESSSLAFSAPTDKACVKLEEKRVDQDLSKLKNRVKMLQ